MSQYTPRDLADEAERTFLNVRGHHDRIAELVAARKRPEHELSIIRERLPKLRAIADVMASRAQSQGELE